MSAWFYIGIFIIGIGLFSLYSRFGKLLQCIFFTAVTGLMALGGLWVGGRLLDLPVSLTPLSALISGILGVPGVIAMLLLNLV